MSDLIKEFQWTEFAVLYETPMWLSRISSLIGEDPIKYNNSRYNVKFHRLLYEITDEPNFRPFLTLLKRSGATKILLQCSTEYLSEVLKQMLQVSLLSENHHLIIADLDAQTIDFSDYRYTGAHITILRIIDPNSPQVREIQEYIMKQKSEVDITTYEDENETEEPEFYVIDTHTALIYDGLMILGQAISQLGVGEIEPREILCSDKSSVWSSGTSILNFMKSVRTTF